MHPEFIARESETDALGRSTQRWLDWLERAKKAAGLESIDGTQWEDGYSLDWAHECYEAGDSPEEFADKIPDYDAF